MDVWTSQGIVTVSVAGTPVRATNNQSSPPSRFAAHSIFFQQVASNTGKIYICDSATANKSTGVGVLAVLAAPTSSFIPSASGTVTYAPNAFNLAEYWIDADVGGEGCLVSSIRA